VIRRRATGRVPCGGAAGNAAVPVISVMGRFGQMARAGNPTRGSLLAAAMVSECFGANTGIITAWRSPTMAEEPDAGTYQEP
jgi:hypothetical protein